MIGRPLEFNPDNALESAMQLFWRNGYESSSLQMLISTMGLSKSSFYQTFKSKHKLFQKSIAHYQNTRTEDMKTQLKQSDTARVFLDDLFYGVTNEVDGPNARHGCLLMNTANEFAQSDPLIADLVSNSIEDFRAVFELAIKQAQQQGDISSDKNAHALSMYLISSMSGLKNLVKAGSDKETIKQIAKTVLSALD